MVLRSRSERRTGSSSQSSSPRCWRRDLQPAMAFRISTPTLKVNLRAQIIILTWLKYFKVDLSVNFLLLIFVGEPAAGGGWMGNSSICVLHCPDLGGGRGTLLAAPPDGRPPHPMCLSIEGGWAGGREGQRDTSRLTRQGPDTEKTNK